MKTFPILYLSLLLSTMTFPALGQLTDADLNKIRLIVKEEVKAEITASEKRMKEYIDLKIEVVNARIDALDKSLNARIDATNTRIDATNTRIDALNTRMDDVDSKFNRIWLAIIALITAAIALPQLIIVYAEKKRHREMQLLLDRLHGKGDGTDIETDQ